MFTPDGDIKSFWILHGWMIQADVLCINDSIVACAHSLSGKGLVISLSSDLEHENWRKEFNFPIKSTPVLDIEELWIVSEKSVVILNSLTGTMQGVKAQLPYRCLSKPLLCATNNEKRLVCASSDWEGGLMIVDSFGNVSCFLENDNIGPVYTELCMLDNNSRRRILISDSHGAVHYVELETMRVVSTIRLSSGYHPLSPPLLLDDQRIVVGSHNGKVICFAGSGEVLWECDCGTAIKSRPLMIMAAADAPNDNSIIIACTTGGHIFRINSSKHEMIEWRYRINAEIWSNPVSINGGKHICFGARDSRIHILDAFND